MSFSGKETAMKDFLSHIWILQGHGYWIIQVFLVIALVLLVNMIQIRMMGRLKKRLLTTRTPWDDALASAVARPLTWLIWIVGLAFTVDVIGRETEAAAIFRAVKPIRDLGVIVVIAWFLIRFIEEAEKNIVARSEGKGRKVDRTTADAIAKLLRISVLITAALVSLQTLGISISGVLAFGGIGGLAVGFAAKDLLANFFGGLMIYLDRPFDVGDWIRSPDREIEGTVEEIGWRLTRIRTFDKRPLYLPNGIFSTIPVENPSRMLKRRIKETIGIRYADIDKMNAITAEVRQMLIDHPEIDESQTLMVNFNAFAPSSIDFFIYTFTHTTVWTKFHEIKQDVLLRIAAIITDHGAEVAFPTSTIHLHEAVGMERSAAAEPLPEG